MAKSPYNAIAVDLPLPDESRGLDRYENAARIFGSWQQAGVVRKDSDPGFYIYKMSFQDEHEKPQEMTGLLGALGLDLAQAGEIMPHEQTMPKDRKDRLSLLTSTRLNTSPIWGLSLAKGLTAVCRDVLERAGVSNWRARDAKGVLHELWPVTDRGRLGAITELVAASKVLLADGHHRYQTACAHALQSRAENGNRPGSYDLVLAFVVELTEDELSIRAIHRLLKGVPPGRLIELIAPWYRIEMASEDLDRLPSSATAGTIGLFTRDGYSLLYPLPALFEAAEDDLDSSRLMVVLNSLPEHELSYEPGWEAAVAAVRDKKADAAFFLRPVPVEKIESVANGGRLMPPKSTFFYPKPRTGMAFRSLA
jgi:uncharacterized protein (DUF1015 family)